MADDGSLGQSALVGIPQIAEIAQVGPSAVGNWRKRHPDFPIPRVQAPSGALFDLGEVERWLIENGKIAGRVPASARLWALADSARDIWRPGQLASFCIACLVYFEASERAAESAADKSHPAVVPADLSWREVRREEDAKRFGRKLRKAATQIEDLNLDLKGLLVPSFSHVGEADAGIARSIAVALDDATDDLSPRFALLEDVASRTELMEASPRGQLSRDALRNLSKADRFAAVYSTPDDLAYLLSQVVGTDSGTIVDLAVGQGGLLLLAAMWSHDESRPPKLVGVEIDEAVARITRSRCYLYRLPADIRTGNALTMDLSQLPKADSVVLDPPYDLRDWGRADIYVDPRWRFGPPSPKNADLAWLQIAVQQLKASGHAGVVLPAATLFRRGREQVIRRAMVEAGVVEGVILLPPRLRVDTSIPLAIWLLRSPESGEGAEEVLLVDASDLGTSSRSQFTLEEEVIDRLGEIVQTWRTRREIDRADAEIAVAVPVRSLTNADLDPKGYRKVPQADVEVLATRIQELRGRVAMEAAQAHHALRELIESLGGDG